MNKGIYINIGMGLGGNISLTYITKELKDKYETVAVCTPYWDVMECDPNIDFVYKPNEIRDFIMDAKANDGYIMTQRLYDMNDFIYKQVSYSDAWRKLCGLETKGDGEDGSTGTHTLDVYRAFPTLQSMVEDVLKKHKKFILLQFCGGASPLQNVPVDPKTGQPNWKAVPYNYDNEPLKRHYPTEKAQEFVNLFRQEHPDVDIITYQLPNEPSYEGAVKYTLPYLCYAELAKSDKCLGAVTIDSSLQHLISGYTKVLTIWGHSEPRSFGHVGNTNIMQDCRRDDILYFSQLGPSAAKVRYIAPAELLEQVDITLFNKEPSNE